MLIVGIVAGLMVIFGLLRWLNSALSSDAGVAGVANKKTPLLVSAGLIAGGAILILVSIVFYKQVNAALGVTAVDPYIYKWVDVTMQQIFSTKSTLPSLQ
jgi:hypothetical protein